MSLNEVFPLLYSSALILHPESVSESVSDELRYRAAIAAKKDDLINYCYYYTNTIYLCSRVSYSHTSVVTMAFDEKPISYNQRVLK